MRVESAAEDTFDTGGVAEAVAFGGSTRSVPGCKMCSCLQSGPRGETNVHR